MSFFSLATPFPFSRSNKEGHNKWWNGMSNGFWSPRVPKGEEAQHNGPFWVIDPTHSFILSSSSLLSSQPSLTEYWYKRDQDTREKYPIEMMRWWRTYGIRKLPYPCISHYPNYRTPRYSPSTLITSCALRLVVPSEERWSISRPWVNPLPRNGDRGGRSFGRWFSDGLAIAQGLP